MFGVTLHIIVNIPYWGWGCFSAECPRRLVKVDCKINATEYREILQNAYHCHKICSFCSKIISPYVKLKLHEWLQNNNVNVLERLSPDLISVKNLWLVITL